MSTQQLNKIKFSPNSRNTICDMSISISKQINTLTAILNFILRKTK